jgi:hypothetical protein
VQEKCVDAGIAEDRNCYYPVKPLSRVFILTRVKQQDINDVTAFPQPESEGGLRLSLNRP